jgi:hypothetical protein
MAPEDRASCRREVFRTLEPSGSARSPSESRPTRCGVLVLPQLTRDTECQVAPCSEGNFHVCQREMKAT